MYDYVWRLENLLKILCLPFLYLGTGLICGIDHPYLLLVRKAGLRIVSTRVKGQTIMMNDNTTILLFDTEIIDF